MGDAEHNKWLNDAIERWNDLQHRSDPLTREQNQEFGQLTDDLAPHYKPAADMVKKAGLKPQPPKPTPPEPKGAPPLPEEPGEPEMIDPEAGRLDEPDVGEPPTAGRSEPTAKDLSDADKTGIPEEAETPPDQAPPLPEGSEQPEIIDPEASRLDEPSGPGPPAVGPPEASSPDVSDADTTDTEAGDVWPETVTSARDYNVWMDRAISRWRQLLKEPHSPKNAREFGDLTDDLAPHYPPAADTRERAGLPRQPDKKPSDEKPEGEPPAPEDEAPPLPEEPDQPEIIDPESTELGEEPTLDEPTGADLGPSTPDVTGGVAIDPEGGYPEIIKDDVYERYTPGVMFPGPPLSEEELGNADDLYDVDSAAAAFADRFEPDVDAAGAGPMADTYYEGRPARFDHAQGIAGDMPDDVVEPREPSPSMTGDAHAPDGELLVWDADLGLWVSAESGRTFEPDTVTFEDGTQLIRVGREVTHDLDSGADDTGDTPTHDQTGGGGYGAPGSEPRVPAPPPPPPMTQDDDDIHIEPPVYIANELGSDTLESSPTTTPDDDEDFIEIVPGSEQEEEPEPEGDSLIDEVTKRGDIAMALDGKGLLGGFFKSPRRKTAAGVGGLFIIVTAAVVIANLGPNVDESVVVGAQSESQTGDDAQTGGAPEPPVVGQPTAEDLLNSAFDGTWFYLATKTGDLILPPAPIQPAPIGVELAGQFVIEESCNASDCTYTTLIDVTPFTAVNPIEAAAWQREGSGWVLDGRADILSAQFDGLQCIYNRVEQFSITLTGAEPGGDAWSATSFEGIYRRGDFLDTVQSAAAMAQGYCPAYSQMDEFSMVGGRSAFQAAAPPATIPGRTLPNPIVAFFTGGFETDYTFSFQGLDGQAANYTVEWSDPPCGAWYVAESSRGDNAVTLVWGYPPELYPACESVNPATVVIEARITADGASTTCRYVGNQSGEGPQCDPWAEG